jgi:predicted nucleotidyltransferase
VKIWKLLFFLVLCQRGEAGERGDIDFFVVIHDLPKARAHEEFEKFAKEFWEQLSRSSEKKWRDNPSHI